MTLSLSDPSTGKIESLACTPEHPLYVQGKGWVEAGDLGVGTSIVTRAGPPLAVQSVDWQRDETGKKPFTVYNLTVQGDHTYFAGNLDGGLWAHNACRVKWRKDIENRDDNRNASLHFESKQEAYKYAGERIGKNPLQGEEYGDPFKYRNSDQTLQMRDKPGDVNDIRTGPHIYIETMDVTGQVIRNLHLRWPGP